MEILATLKKNGDRFEMQYPELNLTIRGDHAEWVLEAAAEVIATSEKLALEGQIEEMATLLEFGEGSEIEVDSARYDLRARFENLPQCLVVLGGHDYRWVAAAGRKADTPIERVMDMSLTRNDSFLTNEPGADDV